MLVDGHFIQRHLAPNEAKLLWGPDTDKIQNTCKLMHKIHYKPGHNIHLYSSHNCSKTELSSQ